MPLHADVLAFLPVLGLLAGVALGMMAPLRRRSARGGRQADRSPAVGGPEPGASAA